jgi:hypothetical protein
MAVHTFHFFFTPLLRSLLLTWLLTWLVAGLGLTLSGCGGGPKDDQLSATAPTLDISSNISGTASGPVTVRFVFSADVASFASGSLPFALRGGSQSPGSFTALSAREFTAAIIPNTNTTGAIELSVPPGAFADSTTRASNTQAYTFSQSFDTVIPPTEPWVDVASNVQGTAREPFTLTLTFNMDVGSSFTTSKLVLGELTPGLLVKLSPTVYTLVVTPPANSQGLALVTLPEGAVTGAVSGQSNSRDFGFVFFYNTP